VIGATTRVPVANAVGQPEPAVDVESDAGTSEAQPQLKEEIAVRRVGRQTSDKRTSEALLAQTRREDAAHRAAHQKPISAEALRVRLGVGAVRARQLVKVVRAEFEEGPLPSNSLVTRGAGRRTR
jgi:hypothetical protein